MSQSFYFYDLETSGVNARTSRVMQFAGQRTNLALEPIGQAHNFKIKLSGDILPEPDAILITGITPQMTIQDGLSEAEFLKVFYKEICQPNTIFVGFNNIRFDDEFMRFMNYRNFYDAYEWQWQDGNSRWDVLDLSRITRALRPDGLKWPFDGEGKPTNRLEMLSKINKIDHSLAHDALDDVYATIALARLIRQNQPKLFDYLLKMRNKTSVAELVNSGQPFVYTSGRYSGEYLKTTVAVKLIDAESKQGSLVYDLRCSPKELIDLSAKQLSERIYTKRGSEHKALPIKVLSYNRCPAVAPLSVLDNATMDRLKIDLDQIKTNLKSLHSAEDFADKARLAFSEVAQPADEPDDINLLNVDEKLYAGFIDNTDKTKMHVVRAGGANELADLNLGFDDKRLELLLPLYKARNFAKSLNPDEQAKWQNYLKNKLLGGRPSQAEKYFARLEELSRNPKLSEQKRYLLKELELYGESIIPDI